MIRRAHPEDIPFLISVARERYPAFNEGQAAHWLDQAMQNPDMLILRGEVSGGVLTIGRPFWGDNIRAHLLFLVARRMPGLSRQGVKEGVQIMREMDRWRQLKGADSFHFGEETGANFEVLARMLGAKKDRPSYTLGGTPLSFAARMFETPAPVRKEQRVVSALEQVFGGFR